VRRLSNALGVCKPFAHAEFAVSWHGARASLHANHYHSCIVVADLNQAKDLKQLSELRGVAMSVWLIVLCDLQAIACGL
jgi:hypothetical protein